jgi:hypothetical protein
MDRLDFSLLDPLDCGLDSVMTFGVSALLEVAADWLHEHESCIEFFDKFLPSDCVPEDVEDPREWARVHGHEDDGSIGFLLQTVESGTGERGVALVLGKGHSVPSRPELPRDRSRLPGRSGTLENHGSRLWSKRARNTWT